MSHTDRLCGKTLAALRAPTGENPQATLSKHPLAETVAALANQPARLICAFHVLVSTTSSRLRAQKGASQPKNLIDSASAAAKAERLHKRPRRAEGGNWPLIGVAPAKVNRHDDGKCRYAPRQTLDSMRPNSDHPATSHSAITYNHEVISNITTD
ncbi:protein of unknown function [Candidatus Filomicrobium marinum]|uniref:Uncharacterized protein n=2 Tax=Filomicrobium TaxID=119044 RepID=A0A0D6JC21_9HYPH|nr:protein of unknown function [Candidatus Filomicrobium marinum]CPR16785.1 protein of unknown function [Candidatus Filomicrobium marinum]SDP59921.1 hypothetical protein SAMN04488061_3471 [Filomicrobium insigne]